MTKRIHRMCIQTREIKPRDEMLKIVVSKNYCEIDLDYKLQGRSIYINREKSVIEKFLKRKKLPLRLEIDKQNEVRKILSEYINE